MTGRSHAAWIAGTALFAGVLLYFSLRGIDWRALGRTIEGARPMPLVAAVALGSLSLFVRAWRWRVLLKTGGDVSYATVFWATSAGLFANNVLPARAGEVLRAVFVSTEAGIENAFVLATVLSERVTDAIALVAVMGIALLILPGEAGWLMSAARTFAVLGLAGASAIALVPLFDTAAARFVARLPMPRGFRPHVAAAVEHGIRGLRALHNPRRLATFVLLTIPVWGLDAYGAVITANALDLVLPMTVALLLISALGLASALPSAPGYIGIYQFVAVVVLAPFGFDRTHAIAYILVVQVLMYVVIGAWGAIGFMRYRRARPSV